jgi:hypothetical protein
MKKVTQITIHNFRILADNITKISDENHNYPGKIRRDVELHF